MKEFRAEKSYHGNFLYNDLRATLKYIEESLDHFSSVCLLVVMDNNISRIELFNTAEEIKKSLGKELSVFFSHEGRGAQSIVFTFQEKTDIKFIDDVATMIHEKYEHSIRDMDFTSLAKEIFVCREYMGFTCFNEDGKILCLSQRKH